MIKSTANYVLSALKFSFDDIEYVKLVVCHMYLYLFSFVLPIEVLR